MGLSRAFVGDESKERICAAVELVESKSSAEVAVSIKRSSGHYGHVDLALGFIAALAGLLYMLYAPPVFPLYTIVVITVGLFASVAAGSRLLPPVRVTLGRRHGVDEVQRAACEQLWALGVCNTRDRSGMLVFVSLHEGRCVVLADLGLQEALPRDVLTKLVETIQGSVSAGPRAFAAAIANSDEAFAKYLPRRADDVDELPNVAA